MIKKLLLIFLLIYQQVSYSNMEIDFKKYEVFRAAKYSEMNPSTRKKLSEFFKPYNEKLYKLIDQNFYWD